MLYHLGWIVLYLLVRAVVGLLAGIRAEGQENVPRTGGVIVAPNHLSFADPPIVESVVKRASWFMATDELFSMKVLGPLARFMRGFPVRQDSPDRGALRKTEDLLRRGESVVVFPEGHVSMDGKLQSIQPGIVLVALRTGAPILPVGLLNTDKLMPPRTFNLRRSPSPIIVKIGRCISAEELAGGKKGRPAVDHGTMLLRRVLLDLTGQRDETPADPRSTERAESATSLPDEHAGLHGASVAEYSRGQVPKVTLEEISSWPTS